MSFATGYAGSSDENTGNPGVGQGCGRRRRESSRRRRIAFDLPAFGMYAHLSRMTTLEDTPEPARSLPQMDGVLVLRKPSGPTSARCLAALKRLGQKKIGHAGTLDPLASGVLLVLLGQATKISGALLAEGGKVYSGTLRLGLATDTWDIQGAVTEERPWQTVGEADVRREIRAWQGVSEQPVPPYSAAKHQGQPLYRLARQGRAAPAKVKRVEISQADTLDVSLPLVRFRVACGSGTYIRSLAHSLGSRLGCGAVLTELTREYSHPFGLDQACDLADLMADPALLPDRVRPIAEALPHWRRVDLAPDEARRVRHGMAVPCRDGAAPDATGDGGNALLLERGTALALARRSATPAGPCWSVVRGLWH